MWRVYFQKRVLNNVIVLVSFADSKLRTARKRFELQAKSSSMFDHLLIFDEASPVVAAVLDNALIQDPKNTRGYGFWLWKPCIVESVLEQLQEDDILVYSDIGNHFYRSSRQSFDQYLHQVRHSDHGILAFQLDATVDGVLREEEWTSNDALNFFNASEEERQSPQFSASVFLIRKCVTSVEVVRMWARLARDMPVLFRDSIPVRPPLIAHRHDQSVFSLVLKRYGIKGASSAETEPQSLDYLGFPIWPCPPVSPIQVRRDKDGPVRKLARKIYRFGLFVFKPRNPAVGHGN